MERFWLTSGPGVVDQRYSGYSPNIGKAGYYLCVHITNVYYVYISHLFIIYVYVSLMFWGSHKNTESCGVTGVFD